MSYDPAYPPNGAEILSAPMRTQFTGLKELIDAINTILAAQVDAVNTINHNEPATATVNLVGNTLHFSFDIPRGGVGAPGQDGQQGPPFAQAIIDAVNTLDAGQAATVSVNFDGTNVRFTFGIPRGTDGGQGDQGIQGPPGEVTNATLANAISGTSRNTNGVATLGLVVSDPPTQGEMQTLVNKVDELILALRN